MEVYVVVNKAMSAREVMGVFSTPEKAQKYMDRFATKRGYFCQVEKSLIRGYYQPPGHVFAAHTHGRHEDVQVLEGIYAELSQAERAAGREGKTIAFSIDSLGEEQTSMSE